jgi:hypothetical protein
MLLFRPIVAYFDTNVFHAIADRHTSKAGLRWRIETCRDRGQLILPASLVVTNEIVDGIGCGDEPKARRSIRQLQAQWQLADWKMLLKPPEELASNEIRAFARGEESPSPYWENAKRDVFLQLMVQTFRGMDGKSAQQLAAELSNIVGDNREQKSSFAERMNEHRDEAVAALRGHVDEVPSFRWLFDARAATCAENLARRAGVLDECKAAGMSRLIERPIIKAGVAAHFALWYTRVIPTSGPPPKFVGSDSRDMHHVMSAAAHSAMFFVCREKQRLPRLIELLTESNLVDFKVVDLDGFLRELPDA